VIIKTGTLTLLLNLLNKVGRSVFVPRFIEKMIVIH